MNLANFMTFLRILAIPVFIGVYYSDFTGHYLVSSLIFILACITDWLDGYLARKLDQCTPFGAFLDPVADKLLVTMALEALLLTAVGCAGAGDVVRVSIDAGDAGAPCIHIRFPAGPMADLSPADAMQPYALKARLPDIGANALAAAGAIAVGQGGDLVLRDEEGGHRVFDVSFSGAPRA